MDYSLKTRLLDFLQNLPHMRDRAWRDGWLDAIRDLYNVDQIDRHDTPQLDLRKIIDHLEAVRLANDRALLIVLFERLPDVVDLKGTMGAIGHKALLEELLRGERYLRPAAALPTPNALPESRELAMGAGERPTALSLNGPSHTAGQPAEVVPGPSAQAAQYGGGGPPSGIAGAKAEPVSGQQTVPAFRELDELLSQGEGQTLEFKSTLRYDLHRKQVHHSIGEEVLFTIAAFMNAHGGTLLIGVAPDGTVLGLEPDLKTFNGSRDRFCEAFTAMVRDYLGPTVGVQLDIRFIESGDQLIFVVEVPRSDEPVYCGTSQDFYVRLGETVRRLRPKEIVDYLRTRVRSAPDVQAGS